MKIYEVQFKNTEPVFLQIIFLIIAKFCCSPTIIVYKCTNYPVYISFKQNTMHRKPLAQVCLFNTCSFVIITCFFTVENVLVVA